MAPRRVIVCLIILSLPSLSTGETPDDIEAFHQAIWRLERDFVNAAAAREEPPTRDSALRSPQRVVADLKEALHGLRVHLPLSGAERSFLEGKLTAVERRFEMWALTDRDRTSTSIRRPFAPDVRNVHPIRPGSECRDAPELDFGTATWSSEKGKSAWFRLLSPEATSPEAPGSEPSGYRLHTGGSDADTVLTVFESCLGSVVERNDDRIGLLSELQVAMRAGEERFLRVEWLGDRYPRLVIQAEPLGNGVLSGFVLEDPSGAPIEDTRVWIYTADGSFAGTDFTDSNGFFEEFGLETGSYRAFTESDDHLDEIWDDHPCEPSCSVFDGDTFDVVSGDVTTISFGLGTGGGIRGAVRNVEGGGVGSVSLTLYDSSGQWLASKSADNEGQYAFGALAAGVYFVATNTSGSTYLDEVWDDIPCIPNCLPTNGTPIVVIEDSVTSGIDFVLERQGNLAGFLRDAATGLPIAFGRVRVYTGSGGFADSVTANSAGEWQSDGLFAGSYFAATNESSLYRNEVYDDIPCDGSCDPTSGTALLVQLDTTTAGVDFELDRLGIIEGAVRDAGSGLPVISVRVELWNDQGSQITQTTSLASGHYEFPSTRPGSYRLVTDDESDWIDQLYDGIPCPTGPGAGCSPVDGTPVDIDVNQVRSGVDFSLALGGAIAGTLRDLQTLQAIDNAEVHLHGASGLLLEERDTVSNGGYRFGGLAGGDYFVVTNTGTHGDEAWDDIPCEPACDPTAADPVQVTEGEVSEPIDFDLTLLGGISGSLRTESGEPISGVRLHVWNHLGSLAFATTSDATGFYQADLSSGIFYVSTDNDLGLPEELWDNIPCPDGSAIDGLCDPLSGDSLTIVGAEPAVTGIDFVLGPLFADGFESGDSSAWSNVVP